MQHRRKGRILKRERGQREALIHSLMRSLVIKGAIVTTEARAKEIRPRLEKLITKEKTGTISADRKAAALIGKDAAGHLKKDILTRLESRKSGFLRITKLGPRKSDSSRMVQISFV